jgi:hypothetical protein
LFTCQLAIIVHVQVGSDGPCQALLVLKSGETNLHIALSEVLAVQGHHMLRILIALELDKSNANGTAILGGHDHILGHDLQRLAPLTKASS